MSPPPISAAVRRDVERISALPAVPKILKVVADTTGMRFAVIARVTAEEWVACAVHDAVNFGLKAGESLEVTTTLCQDVRRSQQTVVMDHASKDPRYCDHPTPKMYRFESYISVPIFLPDGEYFGNVCALDPNPRPVNQPKVIAMVELFAQLIGEQLAASARENEREEKLLAANEAAELREQFMAVLGHDLRNPLQSVNMGADMLLRRSLGEFEHRTVERIRSSGKRMARLVNDLLDFARTRLGSGIHLRLEEVDDLETALRHVVAELESSHPDRSLTFESSIEGTVRCDRERVAQLLSNLVANALEHGSESGPVAVKVRTENGQLSLSVSNDGDVIPETVLNKLFRPYARGGAGQGGTPGEHGQSGLGLGLFIVHQIAQAHGGEINVVSTEEGTRFTFTLPLGREAAVGPHTDSRGNLQFT